MRSLTISDSAVVSGGLIQGPSTHNYEKCIAGTSMWFGVVGAAAGAYATFGFGAGAGFGVGSTIGAAVGTFACDSFFE